MRAKQIDLAKKNGALVIYDFNPNEGVGPAALPGRPKRDNLIIRLLATLQASIESDAKRLCAPDIVLRFNSQDAPCRSSDGKPPRTEDGYTVVSAGPTNTVTEKLDILKREIWNYL